jgi:hypothetical protein
MNWTKSTAVSRGVMRNGFDQWGVTAELGALAWCPGQAISYTSLSMTLYGRGEVIRGAGNVSKSEADRLVRRIGERGISKQVYRQTKPGCYPVGR